MNEFHESSSKSPRPQGSVQPGLGTVQLGMPYGNNSGAGVIPYEEMAAIVNCAIASGIRFIDTAASYGSSEERLGTLLKTQMTDIEVVTKIPKAAASLWKDTVAYEQFVIDSARKSLDRLHRSSFDTLFFHQCDLDFLRSTSFRVACSSLLDRGYCSGIGVSVYEPEEALLCMELGWVNNLQIPVNIVDRRFVTGLPVLMAKEKGTRLIARSIVLQGVLVPGIPLPPVKHAKSLLNLRAHCQAVAAEFSTNLLEICLSYIFQELQGVISIGLLGADSMSAIEENIAIINRNIPYDKRLESELLRIGAKFSATGLNNPSHWNI